MTVAVFFAALFSATVAQLAPAQHAALMDVLDGLGVSADRLLRLSFSLTLLRQAATMTRCARDFWSTKRVQAPESDATALTSL